VKNVHIKAGGKFLAIRIDPTQEFGSSIFGKNTIVAATEGNGNVAVPKPEVKIGINCYKPMGA